MILQILSLLIGTVGAHEMWRSADEHNWIRFFVGLTYFLVGVFISQ